MSKIKPKDIGGRQALAGLMVSVLVSESSSPGLRSGQGHCIVFLGRTLSHSAHLAMDLGVEKLLVVSCYKTWDKFQPNGPLVSCTDFHTFAKYFSKYATLLQYAPFFYKSSIEDQFL